MINRLLITSIIAGLCAVLNITVTPARAAMIDVPSVSYRGGGCIGLKQQGENVTTCSHVMPANHPLSVPTVKDFSRTEESGDEGGGTPRGSPTGKGAGSEGVGEVELFGRLTPIHTTTTWDGFLFALAGEGGLTQFVLDPVPAATGVLLPDFVRGVTKLQFGGPEWMPSQSAVFRFNVKVADSASASSYTFRLQEFPLVAIATPEPATFGLAAFGLPARLVLGYAMRLGTSQRQGGPEGTMAA